MRPHALGRGRDLPGAVARSAAMLLYLDNAQSRANPDAPTLARLPRALARAPGDAPRGLNENYARELLELHTVGVDGGYTQQDVIEVARALTGWSVQPPALGGAFVFRPALHDAGEKTVLGGRLPRAAASRTASRCSTCSRGTRRPRATSRRGSRAAS